MTIINKMTLKIILMTTILAELNAKIQPCSEETGIDITKGTHLPNGVIYHNGIAYNTQDYFIQNDTNTEIGCVCLKEKCVRKCCPSGYAYNRIDKICENSTQEFSPSVFSDFFGERQVNISENYHVVFGILKCSTVRIRLLSLPTEFHLRTDGKLFIETPNSIPPWTVRDVDHYCLDTFVAEQDGEKTARLDALACFADETQIEDYTIATTGMLISCVFIVMTLLVYAVLPELRNLHGRVLMAYLFCLLVGFIFLSSMQLLLTYKRINIEMCLVFTFIIYFSLLSGFFWLNVMCFDIWWTFSGKSGFSLERLSSRARLVAYASYAFGVPSGLTLLLAVLEFAPIPAHPMLPMIKKLGCFLFGRSKLLYFYGPITIVCLVNMLFFILTAIRIAKIKQQTSVLKSKESATHDRHSKDKQRFLLYVKLFLVMGVNWLLEVASHLFPEAVTLWKITDAYNVLIGFTIFIIFICKRKILRLIKKRYKQMTGEPMSRTQTTSTRTMSSREEINLNSVKKI